MAKPPPSIAVTSTLAMVRAAEERGFETADLLAAAKLTRERLEDPDERIPGPVVLALWNALRERTGDPALQLAAPTCLPFGAYHVIDYMVGASATVGAGIDRFARFFRLIADGVSTAIEAADDEWRFVLAMTNGGAVPPVYVDYVFAALVRRIRMRIRPRLRVLRVDLRQPEPAVSHVYRQMFEAPVHFGVDADRLCFDAKEWHAPMDTADPALAKLLEEHARTRARRVPGVRSGFTADVENAIAATLPQGGSARVVAHALHMSVRTLQRKLVDSGVTFRQVADDVRRRLAEEYLTQPKVSMAEVAFLLGFSDQSTFHRAFRRWTGEPPGRWRRRVG